MESIFRAAFMYLFLMLIIRIAGNRTLNEMTTFDFVLLLILGDASQQAITSNDYSVTNAVIIIITLVSLDIMMSFIKENSKKIERLLDGTPYIVVENGKPIKKMMERLKLDDSDILESARKLHGLERMDQIKFAILEKGGEISIIPKQKTLFYNLSHVLKDAK